MYNIMLNNTVSGYNARIAGKRFTPWARWVERNEIPGIMYPGVYCITISEEDISGREFNWIPEIKYIGMTVSKEGLKNRLKQFDTTMRGGEGHGGAYRFRRKHQDPQKLEKVLYVSVCSFPCGKSKKSPEDLRIMGQVVGFEYDCFAEYVERFVERPEFLDEDKSPKGIQRSKKA